MEKTNYSVDEIIRLAKFEKATKNDQIEITRCFLWSFNRHTKILTLVHATRSKDVLKNFNSAQNKRVPIFSDSV